MAGHLILRSFLMRKGRFLAVVMRMSAACSVERKVRPGATILFPFGMHMICSQSAVYLGLREEKASSGQQQQRRNPLSPPPCCQMNTLYLCTSQ